jgi:hypothetical protein
MEHHQVDGLNSILRKASVIVCSQPYIAFHKVAGQRSLPKWELNESLGASFYVAHRTEMYALHAQAGQAAAMPSSK